MALNLEWLARWLQRLDVMSMTMMDVRKMRVIVRQGCMDVCVRVRFPWPIQRAMLMLMVLVVDMPMAV